MRFYSIFDDYPQDAARILEAAGATITIHPLGLPRPDHDQMKAILEEYDGVIIGTSQMISEDMFGKRSILTLLPPDNVFGETWSLLRLRNRTISFRAAEKSTVLLLDYGHIFHECNLLCRYHHRMVENMVEIIAGANLELIEKLEVSTRLTIREKLLTYLVREAQRSRSTTFTIPMSQTELADYIGADRTAMLRELTNMKKDGLIDYSRRTFTLYYQG